MARRISWAFLVLSFLLGSVITEAPTPVYGQTPAKAVHRFRVGKLAGKWKVYDSNNSNNRMIIAKRGDVVNWLASGSNVFLQFSDETIFGTDEANATDGKELILTVSPNAKPGRYVYSIFCAKEGKFATGDSPPVIIIQ